MQSFIDELSITLDKSFSRYDSITVMGDMNIDTTEAEQAKLTNRLLQELCVTYDLSNLVTETPFTRCRYDLKTAPLTWYRHDSVTD